MSEDRKQKYGVDIILFKLRTLQKSFFRFIFPQPERLSTR